MYNHNLDTFIRASELGSFSKVAEENFISPSAVIQQINHLESDLNVKLFDRTKKGVTLTPAGEYLLLESKALIQRSNDIRSHLSTYSTNTQNSIVFGSNQFHMPSLLFDYWPLFVAKNESASLSSYSFNENGTDIRTETDLIEGIYFDEPLWQKDFTFHQITYSNLSILVPEDSELSKLNIITHTDLRTYVVTNIHSGVSKACDAVTNILRNNDITVEEAPIYSTSIIIDSIHKNKPIVIPSCWKNFHPRSVLIPYVEEYSLPYGFFLSTNASKAAKSFLKFITDNCHDN